MANIRQILVGLAFWFFGFLKVYFDSFGLNTYPSSHTVSKQTKKTKQTVNSRNTNNWVHRCIWLVYSSGQVKAPPLILKWSAK